MLSAAANPPRATGIIIVLLESAYVTVTVHSPVPLQSAPPAVCWIFASAPVSLIIIDVSVASHTTLVAPAGMTSLMSFASVIVGVVPSSVTIIVGAKAVAPWFLANVWLVIVPKSMTLLAAKAVDAIKAEAPITMLRSKSLFDSAITNFFI